MATPHRLAGLCLATVLAGAVGCARKSVNTISPAVTIGVPRPLAHQRIVTDRRLARRVRVSRIVADRAGDLLHVQVTLTNRTRKTVSIEYRFEWTDAKGLAVATPASRWAIRHLSGGDTTVLSAVAPRAAAEDFVLKLKRR